MMNSAQKFIAKCRRRGYDDEQIRSAAMGKSAIVRGEIFRQLTAPETDRIATNDEAVEVEAFATDANENGETIACSDEARSAETIVEENMEITPLTTNITLEEMIDDCPPATAVFNADALRSSFVPKFSAFAESENTVEVLAEIEEETACKLGDEATGLLMTKSPAENDNDEREENTVNKIVAAITTTNESANLFLNTENHAPEKPADIIITIEETIELPLDWLAKAMAVSEPAAGQIGETASEVILETDENIAGTEKVIAPHLSLVETKPACKNRRKNLGKALALRPPYAISVQETATRLARLADDDKHISASAINFTEATAELRSEEWQGVVEDFDLIARPSNDGEMSVDFRAETIQQLTIDLLNLQSSMRERATEFAELAASTAALRKKIDDQEAIIVERECALATISGEQEAALVREQAAGSAIALLQKTLMEVRGEYDLIIAENECEISRLNLLRLTSQANDILFSEQTEEIKNVQLRLEDQRVATELAQITIADLQKMLKETAAAFADLCYENQQWQRDNAETHHQLSALNHAFTAQTAEVLRLGQANTTLTAEINNLAHANFVGRNERIALAQNFQRQAEQLTERDSQIRERDSQIAERDEQIVERDRQIFEREQQLTNRDRQIAERDAQITTQKGKIEAAVNETRTVRIKLKSTENSLSAVQLSFDATTTALETLTEKYDELERDYNVLLNETVPNLQQDKEDLIALAGEEISRAEEMREIVSSKSRRSSYLTVIAAAACVAVAILPFFSQSRWETRERELSNNYAEQLTMLETERDAGVTASVEMRKRVESLENSIRQTVAERQGWRNQAVNLQKELRAERDEIGRLRAAALEISATTASVQTAMHSTVNNAAEGHYNEIRGVDEWLDDSQKVIGAPANRRIEPADNFAENSGRMIEMRTVLVKKGEGLSQVLWRVCGQSTPELVARVARYNQLKTDGRGNPLLKIGQPLRVPTAVSTAMLVE